MSSFDSIEDFDFTEIVNKHSDAAKHKTLAEVYDITAYRSIGQKEIPYNEKKKGLRDKVGNVIIGIVIFALLATGGALVIKSVHDKNVVDGVRIVRHVSDDIDDKIKQYYDMMNHTGDEDNRIEEAHRYDEANKGAYVSYRPGTFINDVIMAAEVDEVEVRCALIAAFNVINAPYREQQFDILLSSISSEERYREVADKYPFLDVSSSKEFLAALGYNDWEEYQLKERKEIKKISQLSQISEGKTR